MGDDDRGARRDGRASVVRPGRRVHRAPSSTGDPELNSLCCAMPVPGWRFSIVSLAALLLWPLAALAQPAENRAEIDAAVRGFMERSGAPGVAVGVVTPAGRRFFWYGLAARKGGARSTSARSSRSAPSARPLR